VRVDTGFVDDADLVVVAFGFPGRFVKYAVRLAREQGLRRLRAADQPVAVPLARRRRRSGAGQSGGGVRAQ
jgi:hypothetical protein